ncbi:MAG: hypothetical protein C0511_01865 [Hyphomicrobium sp.]|nr:hypothetical protein [Hyphomicrobium sp.]PPC83603.1 MAG: hypothetical protein CTY40_01860 [Hyphomicrobium sp.]
MVVLESRKRLALQKSSDGCGSLRVGERYDGLRQIFLLGYPVQATAAQGISVRRPRTVFALVWALEMASPSDRSRHAP